MQTEKTTEAIQLLALILPTEHIKHHAIQNVDQKGRTSKGSHPRQNHWFEHIQKVQRMEAKYLLLIKKVASKLKIPVTSVQWHHLRLVKSEEAALIKITARRELSLVKNQAQTPIFFEEFTG